MKFNSGDARSYKEVHEAFVSNLKGTSAGDVFIILVHLPLAILLLKLVQGSSRPLYLRDLMYLALPLLLSLTVLADFSYLSGVLLLIGELFVLQMRHVKSIRVTDTDNSVDTSLNPPQSNQLTFISLFKGGNVLLTCIAILAVDFRVFPRRFAKTETFGLSLMDVGVGTFIFSSAITSRYAKGITGRGKSSSQSSSTPISAAGGVSNSSSNVYRIVQRLAVLVLGLGRMVVIKTLGYQEHVTEYGVDWNFFVTLFCVWSAADLAHRLLPRWAIPWLASTILLGYQLLLTHFSLTDYILSAPRTGFLSQNREGIFSLCGLLPLYLLSEHLAHKLFFSVHDNSKVNSLDIQDTGSSSPRVRPGNIARLESGRFDASTSALSSRSSSHSTEDNIPTLLEQPTTLDSTTKAPHTISILGLNWQVLLPRHCRPLARQLSILSGSAWSMWWLTSALIQPASRRLMNLSFILFCLSLCGTLLLLIFLVDSIGPRSSPATSLEYCNSSQLPVFILANLLTGVINMVLPTIFVAPTPAMLTLTIYTAVVVGIAWVLGSRKLS